MRFKAPRILLACALVSFAQSVTAIEHTEARIEQTAAAEANVSITICLASGNITVHGWDRREVRARSDARALELRSNKGADSAGPASHLDVLLSNRSAESGSHTSSCEASNDIELDVPREAVLQLHARDGLVRVVDVAEAHAQTETGDIQLERITRSVEAATLNGNISLTDSSGSVNLHSVSGDIQVSNLRPVNAGDDFRAASVTGEITLDRVSQARIEVGTVSGSMTMTGPLARAGRYAFKSMSGDVTLNLPTDSSFRINARISRQGEITTDFPLKLAAGSPGTESESERPSVPNRAGSGTKLNKGPHSSQFAGVYGTGDASISLFSFSGTLYLRRK